jgi:hypothetical protein
MSTITKVGWDHLRPPFSFSFFFFFPFLFSNSDSTFMSFIQLSVCHFSDGVEVRFFIL